jgi:Holliday junction resolvase RusA-like endonuclease
MRRRNGRENVISFFIPERPVPQARPRTFIHKSSGKIVTMNPRNSEEWKKAVGVTALPHRPEQPFDSPVKVSLEFYLPKPKGRKEFGWHAVRPDLDNLAKGVLDALIKARFITDDSRVSWLECRKAYANKPGVGVKIERL